ncbi:bifunctional pyr operon transcriptional regulator/uracil phosphoribosyltransferase PyrR [Carnobacteriaceae bacterium zg-ZUI252]|nr:bifunctional pyr operon transcriptional regulator/uracil phosphoribosyltransferase PyrR [Carnobacteriaceae bacterium zg-ZUI252]MBS4770109.1 bifunctional pyr operon transcriptional regulator/uracil phosphoribosyltransferase PyrR [Carnobacteriaceae bacterium zg-ZUI240]
MDDIIILDEIVMKRSLTRMTHEILEKHKGTNDLVILGIRTRGVHLAKRIVENIEKFEGVRIPYGELDITMYRDDRHTSDDMLDPTINETNIPFDVTNKNVVLVDDVMYTARTIRAAMDATMAHGRAKKITVAILVDRGHRELPIKADYIGKNIPTSRHEQVEVRVVECDGEDKVLLKKV